MQREQMPLKYKLLLLLLGLLLVMAGSGQSCLPQELAVTFVNFSRCHLAHHFAHADHLRSVNPALSRSAAVVLGC